MRRIGGLAVAVIASLGGVAPTRASAEVAFGDLQAATRSLGFLESLQHNTAILLGVVYSDVAGGRAEAARTAARLSVIVGPNSSTIRAVIVAVEDLPHDSQHFDALYLMPGAVAAANAVSDYVRQHRVVSISGDPACVNAQCCVLMVHAGSSVNIVLDTALAAAAGARFSSVFTMMVQRK